MSAKDTVKKPNKKGLIAAGIFRDFINEESYSAVWKELNGSNGFPDKISEEAVEKIIVFLNDWNCRLADEKSSKIKEALRIEEWKRISELRENSIFDENFDDILEEKVKQLYNELVKINGVGITIASKILHILLPELLVMIDHEICSKIVESKSHNFKNYKKFQLRMHEWAKDLKDDFKEVTKIYKEMNIEYWTITKAIDAYNWITITKNISLDEKIEEMEKYLCGRV